MATADSRPAAVNPDGHENEPENVKKKLEVKSDLIHHGSGMGSDYVYFKCSPKDYNREPALRPTD